MTKRFEKQLNSFKYKGEPIKITVGTLVLCGFCILLLIIATFTQITITNPFVSFNALSLSGNEYEIPQNLSRTYGYIPQIPTIFFIVALLGRKFGILTILGYIILGLFFPIFALGGGISYLFEYGFGYIMAFIPAVFFTGTLLKIKTDVLRIMLNAILGVLTIHILGVLYMLFVGALRHAPMDLILSWISSLSGVQIFYDMFFTILAIYLGRFARKFFWIIMC